MDNHDPDFVKSFAVDYFFEEQQNVKFEVRRIVLLLVLVYLWVSVTVPTIFKKNTKL